MKPPSPSETASEHHVREIAHDFNNLLTAIIGAADAVLRRPEIDPESRDDIANMREGARRGAVLIRRLQLGSDAPPAAGEFIYINASIRATSRLLAHRLGPRIVLTLELEDPDSQVRAEPAQLDRVLLNLIANARQCSPCDRGDRSCDATDRMPNDHRRRAPCARCGPSWRIRCDRHCRYRYGNAP
jgi:signal transduction histidine kinase